MKVDLGLTGVVLDQVAERTATLAALGADGVYCAEGPHDIFVPLTLAAGTGTALSITTNAAVAFPRNPIHLAHAAYDLQVLSQGRFHLGLAPQVPAHITRRFGLEWSSPVERMRELVGALRAIFSTWQDATPLAFEGRFYRHSLMTPMFNPGPTAYGPPPIVLGGLGPRMTAMTAEVADGLAILPFNSRRSLTDLTMAAAAQGLIRRDPSLGRLQVICGVIVGVGEGASDIAAARDGARSLLGFYGSTPAYRRVLEAEGRGDLQAELAGLVRQGRWGELGAHVPDELVDALAVCGTPAECAEQIRAKVGDVADRIALFTPVTPPDGVLSDLMAALRA
ncbi:MAG TPA: TIGR03617 family F420-dependent LLM class oxidoreductase [Acidimicrobiales bacterium]|jgi:probable F420-dependent oxidoreductase|nr:TIGR03617 family F420-dependent LLM class oxidoreductase [Acidimicrobiales bacterium]